MASPPHPPPRRRVACLDLTSTHRHQLLQGRTARPASTLSCALLARAKNVAGEAPAQRMVQRPSAGRSHQTGWLCPLPGSRPRTEPAPRLGPQRRRPQATHSPRHRRAERGPETTPHTRSAGSVLSSPRDGASYVASGCTATRTARTASQRRRHRTVSDGLSRSTVPYQPTPTFFQSRGHHGPSVGQ